MTNCEKTEADLFEESFLGCGAGLWQAIVPFREWQPSLMPEKTDLKSGLGLALAGTRYDSVSTYSKEELVLRALEEEKYNKRLRERMQCVLAGHDLARPERECGPAAIAFLVEGLLHQAPRWLCHPIMVSPLEDEAILRPSVDAIGLSSIRRLVAVISYTFWWKYYYIIPASIRGLAWTAIMKNCQCRISGDFDGANRAQTLCELLIDGNWPIAIDANKELIVLVAK